MALTTLKTVLKTVTVISSKLTAPADRIGLGFAVLAYPTDNLSLGQFPTPHNPEPEQGRSRQEQSVMQMREQMQTGGSDAVPPVGSTGCLSSPGSTADRVSWPVITRTPPLLTSASDWPVTSTDPSRDRFPKVNVRVRLGRDCQSPDRTADSKATLQKVAPIPAAGK
ncbi:MAG: hypothetical protein L0241_26345 [Planctomycetia bacterium]|nr:hypothetical protein [Planctomycetia bacterium]